MISPTGEGIRGFDEHGSGRWGAPRGGRRTHRGIDFIVADPGDNIVCPIENARVVRLSRPYIGTSYSGLILKNDDLTIQMFYLEPLNGIVGKLVNRGAVIGHAQDISLKYPGMTPHIHLRILDINPTLFLNRP